MVDLTKKQNDTILELIKVELLSNLECTGRVDGFRARMNLIEKKITKKAWEWEYNMPRKRLEDLKGLWEAIKD